MTAQISCSHLEPLVDAARAAGGKIGEVSTGWSEARVVVEFQTAMSEALRLRADSVAPPLRYYSYAGSPHNRPDEGFVCENCKVVLSFPARRA